MRQPWENNPFYVPAHLVTFNDWFAIVQNIIIQQGCYKSIVKETFRPAYDEYKTPEEVALAFIAEHLEPKPSQHNAIYVFR